MSTSDKNEKSYRRSISLPKQFPVLRNKSLRQGAIKPPVRLSSVSYNPYHTNQPAISELCAELDIAEPRPTAAPSHAIDLIPGIPLGESAVDRAFRIPEILYLIFEQLDALNVIPHELSQKRRKPLSLRHAQLIYGDKEQAEEAWKRAKASVSTSQLDSPGAGIYACLFVNSTWHVVARRVLERTLHFSSSDRWCQFLKLGELARKPRVLVIHKLGDAHQVQLDQVTPKLGGALSWLEFYTCPGLVPSAPLLAGGAITRLVLPGCAKVNDRTLVAIAEHCPNLQYLDLRACEQVSDKGLKIIAKYCPQLQLLNVGRTGGSELITYKGVKHIARQTQLNTIGLAGCAIDDRAIWELALHRGEALQRLSLNNCHDLSDASIPRILGYTPNLTVLEIRGCTRIHNMRPLALFKYYKESRGQPPLIEGCEVIEQRIQHAVHRLRQEISHRFLSDCREWVNMPDNDPFYLC